jgi:hypothetical protein
VRLLLPINIPMSSEARPRTSWVPTWIIWDFTSQHIVHLRFAGCTLPPIPSLKHIATRYGADSPTASLEPHLIPAPCLVHQRGYKGLVGGGKDVLRGDIQSLGQILCLVLVFDGAIDLLGTDQYCFCERIKFGTCLRSYHSVYLNGREPNVATSRLNQHGLTPFKICHIDHTIDGR